MRVMSLMVRRNILRTFRNKGVILLLLMMSLLPSVMLLVLGNTWMVPGFNYVVEDTAIAWELLRANIFAVTLAVAMFVTPVSIIGLVSEDFENKTIHNFLTAPIKRSHISFGYIISGVIFGMIFNVFILIVGQLLLFVVGDGFIGIIMIGKILLFSLLVLTSLSTIIFYFMSRVKSAQTASSMTGLIGGFAPILGGVYIQLSMFPSFVRTVINFLPFSHALSILKRLMIEPIIDKYNYGTEIQDYLFDSITINLQMFGETVIPIVSIGVIVLCMIIFGGLNILRFKNLKKK